MAMIDTLKRWAKLGFFLGIGGAAALVGACGDESSPPADADADGGGVEDAAATEDAATEEADDGGQDLADIPLE